MFTHLLMETHLSHALLMKYVRLPFTKGPFLHAAQDLAAPFYSRRSGKIIPIVKNKDQEL